MPSWMPGVKPCLLRAPCGHNSHQCPQPRDTTPDPGDPWHVLLSEPRAHTKRKVWVYSTSSFLPSTKKKITCFSFRPNFLPRRLLGSALAPRLEPQERRTALGEVARAAGALVGAVPPSRARVRAGGKDAPHGPSGRPDTQPAGPGSSLPDGGRFLLSRLTARLNISAGAPGRKEEQPGRAAAEPKEGEEEEAVERRSRFSTAPARPAPALPPSPLDAAWRARCALPAHPGGDLAVPPRGARAGQGGPG